MSQYKSVATLTDRLIEKTEQRSTKNFQWATIETHSSAYNDWVF